MPVTLLLGILALLEHRHAVSALTLALWDLLLALDQEISLIWLRAWDLTKVVYLFMRYCVLSGLLYTAYGACPSFQFLYQPLTFIY